MCIRDSASPVPGLSGDSAAAAKTDADWSDQSRRRGHADAASELPPEAGARPERQDGEEVSDGDTTGRVEEEPRGEGRVV